MKALGKGSIASIVRVGLTIAWIALWVAACALTLAAVGYAAALVLTATGAIDASVFNADGNLTIDGNRVRLEDLGGVTWPVVVPALLIGAVAIGGALMIVWRLKKLFDSFCSGEPFRKENADHLRAIWIIMLSIEIARYLLLALTGVLLAAFGGPIADTVEFEFKFDISTWASIFILVVLAEVFREGARLKEEQELTI